MTDTEDLDDRLIRRVLAQLNAVPEHPMRWRLPCGLTEDELLQGYDCNGEPDK